MFERNHINLSVSAFLCVFCMICSGVTLMPSLSFSAEKTKAKPTVMSLDYCADQYVLLLADENQITAVSKDAEEIFSFYRERAKTLPKSDSSIEEVIALHPDVALQTYSMAAHMSKMTEASQISLVTTNFGSDPQTVYKNVSFVGEAIAQETRAQNFNQNYQSRIDEIISKPTSKLKVVYVTSGGVTSGVGTSVDDIIKLSGFESYAASKGYNGWVSIPLEDLIMDPPDIFISGFFNENSVNQSNWSLSRHKRLLKMINEIPTITIPSSYIACSGLFMIDAAEYIRSQASNMGLLEKESVGKNE
jgi:iron complex transport system substrate-binding protein